jgi:ABC-2 type transport system permease protein
MAYLVLAEGVFAAVLEKAQSWLVRGNFDAFVRHDAQYYVTECKSGSDGSYACDSVVKTLTFEHGAWYLVSRKRCDLTLSAPRHAPEHRYRSSHIASGTLATLAVVMVLLGGWVFHRRDVN